MCVSRNRKKGREGRRPSPPNQLWSHPQKLIFHLRLHSVSYKCKSKWCLHPAFTKNECFINEDMKNNFCTTHAMDRMVQKRKREREGKVGMWKKYDTFYRNFFKTFFHECLNIGNKFVDISISLHQYFTGN